jgi:hypothetical protein
MPSQVVPKDDDRHDKRLLGHETQMWPQSERLPLS